MPSLPCSDFWEHSFSKYYKLTWLAQHQLHHQADLASSNRSRSPTNSKHRQRKHTIVQNPFRGSVVHSSFFTKYSVIIVAVCSIFFGSIVLFIPLQLNSNKHKLNPYLYILMQETYTILSYPVQLFVFNVSMPTIVPNNRIKFFYLPLVFIIVTLLIYIIFSPLNILFDDIFWNSNSDDHDHDTNSDSNSEDNFNDGITQFGRTFGAVSMVLIIIVYYGIETCINMNIFCKCIYKNTTNNKRFKNLNSKNVNNNNNNNNNNDDNDDNNDIHSQTNNRRNRNSGLFFWLNLKSNENSDNIDSIENNSNQDKTRKDADDSNINVVERNTQPKIKTKTSVTGRSLNDNIKDDKNVNVNYNTEHEHDDVYYSLASGAHECKLNDYKYQFERDTCRDNILPRCPSPKSIYNYSNDHDNIINNDDFNVNSNNNTFNNNTHDIHNNRYQNKKNKKRLFSFSFLETPSRTTTIPTTTTFATTYTLPSNKINNIINNRNYSYNLDNLDTLDDSTLYDHNQENIIVDTDTNINNHDSNVNVNVNANVSNKIGNFNDNFNCANEFVTFYFRQYLLSTAMIIGIVLTYYFCQFLTFEWVSSQNANTNNNDNNNDNDDNVSLNILKGNSQFVDVLLYYPSYWFVMHCIKFLMKRIARFVDVNKFSAVSMEVCMEFFISAFYVCYINL